jgi:hypothetical protein
MIQAYTIQHYWICQVTGQVVAKVSFCINEGIKEYEKLFPSNEAAQTFLKKERRDWFLTALEKYIQNKKQIIESATPDATKQKALQVCLTSYDSYLPIGINTIAERFLKGKQYYEAILPNPNNNSYESSQNNLNELIKFCELQTKKTTT